MTNREKLQENYEDSVLALLMDEFAESEGRRYIEENERLRQDPAAAVPEEFHARAMRLIDREFSKKNHAHTGGKMLRILGRFAIAALIAVLLFGAAFALSETVRTGTLNLLMQIDEKIATWQFAEEESAQSGGLTIMIGWLPDGFKQGAQSRTTPSDVTIDCANNNGEIIRISVHESEDLLHTLDLEESDDMIDVAVQGCDGMLVLKEGTYSIYWRYFNTELVVAIESEAIDSDTLFRIAESVQIIG